MPNKPQNQSGGGNQPMGQKPASEPVQSSGFGPSEPVRKPAQQPAQSVAKEQGTSAPYQSPKAEPEPVANWVPAFPAAPAERKAEQTQEKITGTLPLKEDTEERGWRILTRGRVIAAIAVLLIVSMYLDRSPANAPEDKSASPNNEDRLALINAQTPNTYPFVGRIQVFFNNGVMDKTMACEKVFAVFRDTKEPSPEAALQYLLNGPSANEGDEGYFTSISPGVALRAVDIDGNTATVDVSSHAAWNVEPGSCRAQAIRAQIRETTKQFTGVQNVTILVDGSRDNIFAR